MEQWGLSLEHLDSLPVLTVSQFTSRLRGLIEGRFPFVRLRGEVSNLRVASSGHMYFVLKDSGAQIRAVCFRDVRYRLRFVPGDGMEVICSGRVSVYEPRGEYQIIVEDIEPKGRGALYVALEELKKKLHKEGLFDKSRKKPMPFCPQRILIITSPTGAAIRDILKMLQKAPLATEITLIPVQVQGDTAPYDIVSALKLANKVHTHFKWDVLVIGRGGGSIEDLWAFNDEDVARALANCVVPTISAVGHEIDRTISDEVADLRLPTPTAAGEWIVNQQNEILNRLMTLKDALIRAVNGTIDAYRQKITHTQQTLRDPRRWIEDSFLRLDDKYSQMKKAFNSLLGNYAGQVELLRERILRNFSPDVIDLKRKSLNNVRLRLIGSFEKLMNDKYSSCREFDTALKMLNPFNVLERGYSIVYRQSDGRIVKEHEDVVPGDVLMVQPARGLIECSVIASFDEEKRRKCGSSEVKDSQDAN